MFTGIVEEIGNVLVLRGELLRIGARVVLEGTRLGDSIAVDGTCLTVTALGEDAFEVGLSPETLRRTSLGELRVGDGVNLERAVAAGGRMGGHYVQGHVDGTGRILERRADGSSLRLAFSVPEGLVRYVVVKGSIAVDGVSLTVNRVDEVGFDVALIPHTVAETTLGERRPGGRVNLEVDLIGKYVEKLLAGHLARPVPQEP